VVALVAVVVVTMMKAVMRNVRFEVLAAVVMKVALF
jgi:hypothetical protein